ncbi:MAG: UDP-3-O-(3-hydroxymyristoyl)glucosamine N-acyltransferase [Bdellovibrionales bacterium]
MADPRFFKNSGPLTLHRLCEITGARLDGGDGGMVVADVAALDTATGEQVSFLDNVKYKEAFKTTKAGACFIHADMKPLAPEGCALLISDNPYKAYALAAQAFYPQDKPEDDIHPQALIDDLASVSYGCHIGMGAVVMRGAKIAAGCAIGAGAVIGENVEIGAHSRIGANAVVSHAIIGAHVNIYSGAKIGQDGFGFAPDPAGHIKVPQLGRVIIEDHVEIGANTCIDRGAGPDTVIGQGTWIDNLVQIGHNVKTGRGCIIVSQVGISGSTVIDDYAVLGGQVGVAGHLHIGKGAQIAAQSGIMRDVPAGETHMGSPSMPMKMYMRQVAALKRLIHKDKNG